MNRTIIDSNPKLKAIPDAYRAVPPSYLSARISELLALLGYTLSIHWFWAGRVRHGLITVATSTGALAYSTDYARSNGRWTSTGDASLTSCYRGSPKHTALAATLVALESALSAMVA